MNGARRENGGGEVEGGEGVRSGAGKVAAAVGESGCCGAGGSGGGGGGSLFGAPSGLLNPPRSDQYKPLRVAESRLRPRKPGIRRAAAIRETDDSGLHRGKNHRSGSILAP